LVDVKKRYVIAAAAHNLGRILFKLFGVGKPRTLQGGYGLAMLVQFIITTVLRSVATLLATIAPWCGPTASLRSAKIGS